MIAVLISVLLSAIMVHAEDQKVKNLDVVPDTAVTILQKVNAFFAGNLTWTMPAGKDIYRDDYTVDPLGRKIPKSTLGKYDDGVR
jgi:hypothetical protein